MERTRMMTDDPIPMEFIGEMFCAQTFPHHAHDWYIFSNREIKIRAYRCYGVFDA